MNNVRHDFASDNTAAMAPEAMHALIEANAGFASGYGSDPITARAANQIRTLLDSDVDVWFVASGTAANALACAALCRPFEAVIAHRHAHVCTDETGAPGLFGHGLGLTQVSGRSGKIDVHELESVLQVAEVAHRQSPAALSLTNATEYGTVYSAEELGRLLSLARIGQLGVHLDGARLANAAAAGFDVRSLAGAGVSLLVLGGTKAGMALSEAIVLFDKTLSRRFDSRLKQVGQLPSKGRFLAAPWIGMLETGAWTRHAAHANAMARRLANLSPFPIVHAVEANGVFVTMDEAALQRLRARGWRVYRFADGSVRFMCSWATTEAAVDEFGEALRQVA